MCVSLRVYMFTSVGVTAKACTRVSLFECPCAWKCLHVCHVCLHVRMLCMHACMYFVSMHLCTHTFRCVCLAVYVSLYTSMHLFTYVFLHACKSKSMSTCRNVWYVWMCAYLCIHVHNYYVCMLTCLSKQMHACMYVARMSYACMSACICTHA